MDDEQATALGLELINMLGLKVKPNGRVDTVGGDKTPLGLVKTILATFDNHYADAGVKSGN